MITPSVLPPVFGGRVSWFRYEEGVDEGCQIISVTDTWKWGPLLRSRLDGDATPYRELMDTQQLSDPNIWGN